MTVPESLFFRLLLRMGAKETSLVEGRQLRWAGKQGRKLVPIAVADVEPLFVWTPTPAVEWLTKRREINRKMPVPPDSANASEMALAAASTFAAISIHGDSVYDKRTFVTERITYYAMTSFSCVSTEPADSRVKASRQLVHKVVSDLSEVLLRDIPRYGSAGARQYGYQVSDVGRLVGAVATFYAHDTSLRPALVELGEKLSAWSLRAAIPTDEAFRVAAELGAEASRWNPRRAAS